MFLRSEDIDLSKYKFSDLIFEKIISFIDDTV